ncbi:glycosyltransferase family 87 protein [Corynebacterium lizhenjunii]|uniref:glycosyltransferase family 87 protein n=1 Tax=Corynebacterium lizhenjunii TaxID=2709394 RepID=UPI0013ED0F3E|nr:glycosyltransferase family 87 protein [Corynebacterium lizhenjunii]
MNFSALAQYVDAAARPGRPVWQPLAQKALWVAAIIAVLKVMVVDPLATYGPDFDPIWNANQKYLQGLPVYDEDYTQDFPHYLYSPGATLLLAPIGILGQRDFARWVLLLAGGLCVLLAMYILVRCVTSTGRRTAFLAFIVATFYYEQPVSTTLSLTNINGFLLLVEVLCIVALLSALRAARSGWWAWQRAQVRRGDVWAAGLLIGVAVTIKPQFVVLAVVPFLTGLWVSLLVAGMFMLVVFAAGWATMAQPMDYVERLLPYLAQARDYNNGSISGIGAQLGWPDALVVGLRVVFLLMVAAAIAALWRWRHVDTTMWLLCTLGVLFCGVLMGSGLLQGYYNMWLFPMLATVLSTRSPMHSPWMWLAYAALSASTVWWGHLPEAITAVLRWQASIAWVSIPLIVLVWSLRNRPATSPIHS